MQATDAHRTDHLRSKAQHEMTASNQRLFHATSSPHGTSSEYQVENGERGEEKEINEHSAGKRAKEGKEGTSKREEEERALFVVERAIQTRRGEEPSKVPFQKDV